MSFFHSKVFDATINTEPGYSVVIDTTKVIAGSIQATSSNREGTSSVEVKLQGSNAVPPNGAWPNQGGTGVGAGWEVPSASWVDLGISHTFTTDATYLLELPATDLLTRWVRAVATPADGQTMDLVVEAFLRDAGT